ncbi:hypothetical protein M409DRAFT_25123 [Zasmidium cellare ATCC 36951]|uniref:Uncharacterized protein n=1 Tax=Zasmidium cellare ATCC 36951 TaxID=1080233 RepID=A0A6A6CER2_ZASCE|nr:uncharacterized protein M409DRAFT_25123 [Zasmidium cellare ATCC 36951]KAF2164730.1 hypothetical protein M409DRAFT_25123 [Zasmidium cellare ATCC 36951]
MADDFDYDDGVLDFDDGWLYVEDEFDLADELAEGQVPDPGYSGTNNEIDMDGYEFDLFGYWDDLDYGDDSYWDYGIPDSKSNASDNAGQKRKRGVGKPNGSPAKRRKTNEGGETLAGESEPLVFRSQNDRYQAYKQDAPLVKAKAAFSFLPDWRERFADEEGPVLVTKMPPDMRKAAEGHDVTPPKARQLGEEAYEEGDDEEDDWEDEMEEDEEGGIALDPEMLKSILREKLGAAGLDGMDEAAFMQTLQKMLSGEGGEDEAAGDLANALLGKLTSGSGDEALSGWLSGQGVALEDDDASSVATGEVAEAGGSAGASRNATQTSPPDSAVEMKKKEAGSTQMPLHSGSPTKSTKKRAATVEDDQPTKKHKKVQFDVPPSSESNPTAPEDVPGPPTSEDPHMSEPTVASTRAANAAAVDVNKSASNEAEEEDGVKQKGGRKRKASSANEKPVGKKTKTRELQDLGPLPEAPSPAPPAKRTRSARSKAGK